MTFQSDRNGYGDLKMPSYEPKLSERWLSQFLHIKKDFWRTFSVSLCLKQCRFIIEIHKFHIKIACVFAFALLWLDCFLINQWIFKPAVLLNVIFRGKSEEPATWDKDLCGCWLHSVQFGPHQVKTCTPQSWHDELQREDIVVSSFFLFRNIVGIWINERKHLNSKSLKTKIQPGTEWVDKLWHWDVQSDHEPPSQAPHTPSCSSELWSRTQINSIRLDLWLWRNSTQHKCAAAPSPCAPWQQTLTCLEAPASSMLWMHCTYHLHLQCTATQTVLVQKFQISPLWDE